MDIVKQLKEDRARKRAELMELSLLVDRLPLFSPA